jgi:hypothetical protein
VLCFLCDSTDCQPVFAQILPERPGPHGRLSEMLIAAPLCRQCRELPQMQRLGRSLRTLKRMWGGTKTRSGKRRSVAFHFNVPQHNYPR